VLASQYGGFGPPEKLTIVERPDPEPRAGELALRVEAFSVNPVDWKMMIGQHRLILRPRFPMIPCFDVCGVVESVGKLSGRDAGRFHVGDRVLCRTPGLAGGAAAERVAVPARVSACAPEGHSPEALACLPLAGQTALQALRSVDGLKSGRRILVIGASGGVGHFAVQIARSCGAEVAGVCSGANAEFVSGLGAQHVIDYQEVPDPHDWGVFDAVVDCVGAASPAELAACTTSRGRVSLVGPEAHQLFAVFGWPLYSRRRARMTMLRATGDDLRWLCERVEDGRIEITLDGVWDGLEGLPAAMARSMTGRVRGKVAVRLRPAV
jgi:NADPH:quinone reductase-like Zn-dependent oxidoreductase